MKTPVLADTGPLYALADPSDQYHARARRELERVDADGCYVAVAYPTLAEAYSLVLKRLGRAYAQRWLKELLRASAAVNPEPGDYVAATAAMARYRAAITLFDAVLAEMSRRTDVAVWTYDHHFEAMGCRLWR